MECKYSEGYGCKHPEHPHEKCWAYFKNTKGEEGLDERILEIASCFEEK